VEPYIDTGKCRKCCAAIERGIYCSAECEECDDIIPAECPCCGVRVPRQRLCSVCIVLLRSEIAGSEERENYALKLYRERVKVNPESFIKDVCEPVLTGKETRNIACELHFD